MSPLWQSEGFQKLQTNNKRPSPKYIKIKLSLARGFLNKISRAIKEISVFTFLFKNTKAGMTVEAALVLPLFLFFFLNLSSAIEMIRLHGNLQLALWDTGKSMAVYGYVLSAAEEEKQEKGEEWWWKLADVAFSYTYVRNQVIKYTGRDYLEASPLTYGAKGLQFWESDILTGDDCMELVITYSVSPLGEMSGFKPLRMKNRYYGHIWNGYRIPGAADSESVQCVVYVTENGAVYHRDKNCTHLALSIQQVALPEALLRRNENGERYSKCEKCVQGQIHTKVYITREGNRYHYNKDCPGLKRTVFTILEEEAVGYRPCIRCFGR